MVLVVHVFVWSLKKRLQVSAVICVRTSSFYMSHDHALKTSRSDDNCQRMHCCCWHRHHYHYYDYYYYRAMLHIARLFHGILFVRIRHFMISPCASHRSVKHAGLHEKGRETSVGGIMSGEDVRGNMSRGNVWLPINSRQDNYYYTIGVVY